MKSTRSSHLNAEGFAHIMMVLMVVVVLGAIGGVGYYVMHKSKKSDSTTAINAAAKQAAAIECKNVDKDLCKFFSSWKLASSYTVASTSTSSDDATPFKSTYVISGSNSHITTSGQTTYDVIAIGDTTTYTKAADGTWWKQTIAKTDADNYKPSADTSFTEDQKDDAGQPITYTAMGKEACGNLTCFKYQVNDPSDTKTKQYIWFDTKDYQLRRERTESSDSTNDSTFSYEKVNITAPSPSKDLGPNQILIPGQSQPETLPNSADVQAQLNAALNASNSDDN